MNVKRMGDRSSVQFESEFVSDSSVVICAHWGGTEFHEFAKKWAESLRKKVNPNTTMSNPETRYEPNSVMVRFIAENGRKIRDFGTVYLGATRKNVDDSDNGCCVIKFTSKGVETRIDEE